jgi:alpha-tubulin suppressor-like RCC1 family protein
LPTKINLSKIKQAACANDYILFLTEEGKLFVMGDKNHPTQNKNDVA